MLSYKKLDVYKLSVEFLSFSLHLLAPLPKGHTKLADQLRRAAMSVPLNIAEASGKVSPAEAAHHFAISRGSAMECGAILDVLGVSRLASFSDIDRGDQLLVRIVSMLSKNVSLIVKNRPQTVTLRFTSTSTSTGSDLGKTSQKTHAFALFSARLDF